MASLAALSAKSAARLLMTWRNRGFVKTGYRRLTIVDFDALARIAGVDPPVLPEATVVPPRARRARARLGGITVEVGSLDRLASQHHLTAREQEVIAVLASGYDRHAIAERLRVKVSTVDTHLQSIYGKLGVSGRDKVMAFVHAGLQAPSL